MRHGKDGARPEPRSFVMTVMMIIVIVSIIIIVIIIISLRYLSLSIYI